MFARLSAFLVWVLVAATVVFWILRLVVHPFEVPTLAMAVGKAAGARGDLSRLLGSAPVVAAAAPGAAPEASARFKLIGVMAPKVRANVTSGDYGLALIAVDGKPARAFSVGASVDSGMVLKSVGLRSASIAQQGAPTVLLELPPLAEPATGRPGSSVPTPALAGTARPIAAVPGSIATLPQMPPSMQNPAMAGQQPPGPMLRPSQAPDIPSSMPVQRDSSTTL